jgi:hypothetical protein
MFDGVNSSEKLLVCWGFLAGWSSSKADRRPQRDAATVTSHLSLLDEAFFDHLLVV